MYWNTKSIPNENKLKMGNLLMTCFLISSTVNKISNIPMINLHAVSPCGK